MNDPHGLVKLFTCLIVVAFAVGIGLVATIAYLLISVANSL